MNSTRRLIIHNASKTMFQTPINGAVNRVLSNTRNCGVSGRITMNRRTIGSLASSTETLGSKKNTSSAINAKNQHPQHPNAFHSLETIWNRLDAAKINNIHGRYMVTITQTKSSDSAPLFSSHVVDDVSSSEPAPTYVVNEDTNLTVTESCLKQIERLLQQRRAREDQPEHHDDGYFLRVFVDAGGCSGFQYQFEVDNELDEDEDIVVIMAKLGDSSAMSPRVVVDETSMGFLEGSTIDYVIEMIKSAFVVSDNPQSESACGCGSSFAMKNFEKFGAKD